MGICLVSVCMSDGPARSIMRWRHASAQPNDSLAELVGDSLGSASAKRTDFMDAIPVDWFFRLDR